MPATAPRASSALVKISVNLPEEVYTAIRDLAARRGVTQTEILRRAISIEKFLEDLRDQGNGQVELIVQAAGKTRQVVFPWLA